MPDEVARSLSQLMSRWDGNGLPADVAGEEISRPLRIVRVAHDLVALAQARDSQAAIAALRRRRGRGYDPDVIDAALTEPEALLRAAAAHDAWERVIAVEPEPVVTIPSAELDTVARAFGEFVDLKVGFLGGRIATAIEQRLRLVVEAAEQALEAQPNRSTRGVLLRPRVAFYGKSLANGAQRGRVMRCAW